LQPCPSVTLEPVILERSDRIQGKSSSPPSPKGTPLKNPGCHPGLVPGSPFHPRKRLASNAPTQPAPHEPKDRSSYDSLSQTCLVNTKHLLLTEITAFGLYCPLSGQSFAVAFFRHPSSSEVQETRSCNFCDCFS
jgi:hypothetical protein